MADQACIIGRTTHIRGNLSGDEDLVVEGRLEGKLALAGSLVVEQSGVVRGLSIRAAQVTVRGMLEGEVQVPGGVTIESGALVKGDLTCGRLMIQDGARVNGRVVLQTPPASEPD